MSRYLKIMLSVTLVSKLGGQSLLLKGSYDIFSELCDHNVKTFPQYGASLKSISYKPYCSNVLTITFAETKLPCFIKVT